MSLSEPNFTNSLQKRLKTFLAPGLAFLTFLSIVLGVIFYFWRQGQAQRSTRLMTWIRKPEEHQHWKREALSTCPGAPFTFPTEGYIGYLWGDSFRPGHIHQGVDIFSGQQPGKTPVYAAYPGYLTRLPDWKSSLIVRIPQDPLHPERQIWTYYTHLAGPEGSSYISDQFPPGIREVFVEQGTLLGYQGNFSGTPGKPAGVHLHFSIVRDDGQGHFQNELEIANTLDPSPYFRLPLNKKLDPQFPITSCPEEGWH